MKSPHSSRFAEPIEPYILAWEGEKGGTGKTTGAMCVAVELQARGFKVLIVDCDPQLSISEWHHMATKRRRRPPMLIAALEPDRQVHSFRGYDVVIIDCPGRIDSTQRSAMMVADLIVFPCRATRYDYKSLKDRTLPVVLKLMKDRPALQARVLLNFTKPTRVYRCYSGKIRRLPVPTFQAEFGDRTIYSECVDEGLGPTTLDPTGPAAQEVRQLVDEIMSTRRAAWAPAHAATV